MVIHMKLEALIKHPAFQSMEPAKQLLLLDCVKQSEGIALEKSLPILLSMNQQMKKSGLQFTTEERRLLIDALTEDMSPSERARVDALRKMIK